MTRSATLNLEEMLQMTYMHGHEVAPSFPDNEEVAGSSPGSPTGGLAFQERAPGHLSTAEGRTGEVMTTASLGPRPCET